MRDAAAPGLIVTDHVLERAAERFGLQPGAVYAIARDIAHGRSVLARKDVHGADRHYVAAGALRLIAIVEDGKLLTLYRKDRRFHHTRRRRRKAETAADGR